ncbi:hypothetical protein [Sorangium sp. So ce854]|uniref:hypothetical protein n=1 Tax=Sorangium sp. So ce854 TaxID=3133322 RepID=UPI003F5FA4D8
MIAKEKEAAILRNGLDRAPLVEPSPRRALAHENISGAEYFKHHAACRSRFACSLSLWRASRDMSHGHDVAVAVLRAVDLTHHVKAV